MKKFDEENIKIIEAKEDADILNVKCATEKASDSNNIVIDGQDVRRSTLFYHFCQKKKNIYTC